MTQEIKLWDAQYKFFWSKQREALLEAGIGYGKSRVASLWLAERTQRYPNSNWIMAASTYKQLKTSVDREFEFYLHDILGLERGRDYHKTNGSPIEYHFFKNNSRIFGHSAVNYDTAFRAGNYNGAWGDEVDYWHKDAVEALRGRIRIFPEEVRWTSSPDGFNHVYEDFYEKGMGDVFRATSMDNPTLSQGYLDNLKKSYDPRKYRQEVLAERLDITSDNIYYCYDREKHFKDKSYVIDQRYPIRLAFDFNIGEGKPMSAVFFQFINMHFHFFGESIIYGANTLETMEDIASRGVLDYPCLYHIHGDATGKNRSTNSNQSDYDIIMKFIRDYRSSARNNTPVQVERQVPRANGSVRERHNRVNSYMENSAGEIRLSLYKECPTLDKGFRLTALKSGGNYIEDDSKPYQHCTTSAGYGIVYCHRNHTGNADKIIKLY